MGPARIDPPIFWVDCRHREYESDTRLKRGLAFGIESLGFVVVFDRKIAFLESDRAFLALLKRFTHFGFEYVMSFTLIFSND